jgi:hypothetical protein
MNLLMRRNIQKNRPHLPVVDYRIGTYLTFRKDMINSLQQNISEWSSKGRRDYAVVLVEMWAYLLDILSYYSERIINEAYVETASLRESVLALSELINYKLNPGLAATVDLAILAEKDKKDTIPLGFKVQAKSIGRQVSKPPVFETDESIVVSDKLNKIGLRIEYDRNENSLRLGNTSHIFDGQYANLKPGDYILIVVDREKWDLRKLTAVSPEGENTRIEWSHGLGRDYPFNNDSSAAGIYLLQEFMRPFGYNGPYEEFMPKDNSGKPIFDAADNINLPGLRSGTRKNSQDPYLPLNVLMLDREYDTVLPGTCIVVRDTDQGKLYGVKDTEKEFFQNYGISANVTMLILDENLPHLRDETPFSIRKTWILGNPLKLKSFRKPLQTSASENELYLDNFYPELVEGKIIFIQDEQNAEVCTIASVNNGSTSGSKITLTRPLKYQYNLKTANINANVIPASHGETIKEEVLGSGNASIPFITLRLKKAPVTFIPSPFSPTGSANTLEVIIDGIRWKEVPNFTESKSNDRNYITNIDENDDMEIIFGDNKTGAIPSTGIDNIRGSYRIGLGISGNIDAKTLTSIVGSNPAIKSITNPLPATGGTDHESEAEAKLRGPTTMKTLDRAVSLDDYENLTIVFTGIAKARASLMITGKSNNTILLTVAAVGGKIPSSTLLKSLRDYLDLRRDPNIPLRIKPYNAVPIDLSIDIQVEDNYLQSKVKKDVEQALSPGKTPNGSYGFFSFERLNFGKNLHLSDIYSVVEGIEGVKSALVRKFKKKNEGEGVDDHIVIDNTEIAICDNDPSNSYANGIIIIKAAGGV